MAIGYKAALCAAALLCAGEAQASMLIQTASSFNGGVNIEKFDPYFGTLDSVRFERTSNSTFYFDYSSQLGTPIVTVTGGQGAIGADGTSFSGDYQSFTANPGTIGISTTTTADVIVTQDLTRFIGTDPFTLVTPGGINTATVNGQPLRSSTLQIGGTRTNYRITYNYTPAAPAVPEPSTWALMLAGLGLTGYALRRRCSRVAFA